MEAPGGHVVYVQTMKTLLRVLPVFVAVACASATNFRETNRLNLERLRVGMDREEVLSLMGVGEQRQFTGSEMDGPIGTGRDTMGVMSVQIPIGGRRPVLYNPHRAELYNEADSDWEVLFYYTRVAHNDGMVTDDELTPLVLRDDVLIGWGWTFWARNVRDYDLPAQLPDPLPETPTP